MAFRFSPHIAFQVRDYKNAVAFYESVMGMQVVNRGSRETELRCGDITFYVEDDPAGELYLEFSVDELSAAVQRLRENGCTLSEVDVPEVHGSSYIVRDPFGLKFHLFQTP